jgi:hypothetical protein
MTPSRGRGRHPPTDVPGDSAAHCGTAAAATTGASMRPFDGRAFSINRQQECVRMPRNIPRSDLKTPLVDEDFASHGGPSATPCWNHLPRPANRSQWPLRPNFWSASMLQCTGGGRPGSKRDEKPVTAAFAESGHGDRLRHDGARALQKRDGLSRTCEPARQGVGPKTRKDRGTHKARCPGKFTCGPTPSMAPCYR